MNPTCAVLLVALVGSAIAFPQGLEPVPVPQDGTILLARPAGPVPDELQQNDAVVPEPAPEAEPQNDEPVPEAEVADPVELAQVNQEQQEVTGEQAVRAKRQFGFGGIGVGVGLLGGGFGGPGFYGGGYPGYGYGGYGGGYGGYGGYGYGGYGGYGGHGGYGHRHHHHHHG